MARRALVLLLVLSVSGVAPSARAESDEAIEECIASLDDATVHAHRVRVEADLRRVTRRARAWLVVWSVVNAGLFAGSIVTARTEDDPFVHEAAIWGAAGSGLSLTMLYAPPIPTVYAPRRLRAAIARAESDRARLALSLALLRHGASFERGTTSPLWHLVNGTYVLGESLILGFRHRDDTGLVVLNGLTSFAITEAQLLTTPRGSRRAMRDLRRDSVPCAASSESAAYAAPSPVTLRLAGVGLSGTF